MKLILSGGGNGKQTKKIDSLFFNLVDKGKVIFIPHSRDRKDFTNSLNWMKKNMFSPCHHVNFEMWENLEDKTIEDLKNIKGIIIGGGNTFKLLKEFKNSGFIKVIKKFIKKNGIVYGISAGAIILTKNIITANPIDENNVNIKNFKGMNFLENKGLFCHYEEKDDGEILEISKKENLEIIGLPEGTGIYVNGDVKEIIGNKSAILFSKKGEKGKELKAGEEFNLF